MSTVLIVEDDADFRRLVTLWLTDLGFEVTEAANGVDGLQMMRRSRPCVILLDLMMPILDGRGFRTRQLLDPDFGSIPVICLSAAHHAPQVASELQISACLTKPVDWDLLIQHVGHHCGLH